MTKFRNIFCSFKLLSIFVKITLIVSFFVIPYQSADAGVFGTSCSKFSYWLTNKNYCRYTPLCIPSSNISSTGRNGCQYEVNGRFLDLVQSNWGFRRRLCCSVTSTRVFSCSSNFTRYPIPGYANGNCLKR